MQVALHKTHRDTESLVAVKDGETFEHAGDESRKIIALDAGRRVKPAPSCGKVVEVEVDNRTAYRRQLVAREEPAARLRIEWVRQMGVSDVCSVHDAVHDEG